MVHRVSAKKLSRVSNERAALLKNLADELILHEKIVTTLARAKATRSFLEKLVTAAKENNLVTRRYLLAKLRADRATNKLLEVIGPAFKERAGGYTRITKLPPRAGDSAKMAVLEFVENVSELAAKKKIKEKPTKVKKAEAEKDKKPEKPARQLAEKSKEATDDKQSKKPMVRK